MARRKTFKDCKATVTSHATSRLRLPDLDSWLVEAHVVDSATGRVDPSVTQSLPQSLVGDVEADDQVELIQIVQGQGLCECPGKTWTESRGRSGIL